MSLKSIRSVAKVNPVIGGACEPLSRRLVGRSRKSARSHLLVAKLVFLNWANGQFQCLSEESVLSPTHLNDDSLCLFLIADPISMANIPVRRSLRSNKDKAPPSPEDVAKHFSQIKQDPDHFHIQLFKDKGNFCSFFFWFEVVSDVVGQ